jgi:glutamate--cysteine ligase
VSKASLSDTLPVNPLEQFIAEFVGGQKPSTDYGVGTEYETFGIRSIDKMPLHYVSSANRASVTGILEGLQGELGWSSLFDGDALVGLVDGMRSVQLEPAGQVEFSGAPHSSLFQAYQEIAEFEGYKQTVGDELGVEWMWSGYIPVHGFDELDLMPKARYGIMNRYLPTRGELALHMMRRTCTVQANLDYSDEKDMGHKLRTAMGCSSIIAAMFANSAFRGGVPNGYRTFRTHIWSKTDSDRCGLLDWVFDGSLPTYERYAEWAMDVPLFFIVRDGQYLDCAGTPFRQFLDKGVEGHRATITDWHTHLSTLFPEVRLKTYLEVRSADCVRPRLTMALPALCKGLFYSTTALDAAWDLVKKWSFTDRLAHREDVAKEGLASRTPDGHRTLDLAREFLDIVTFGLDEQKGDGDSESVFLEPLRQLLMAGDMPIDEPLRWYGAQGNAAAEELTGQFIYRWHEDCAGLV